MANDINTVVLVGRLTRDIEVAYTGGGLAIGKMSVAVNRSKKNGDQWIDEVSYFDVKVFGKTAENLQPYLKKGQQIGVEGFLKQERWEKDGQKQSKVTIGAENIELLGGKKEESANYGNQGYQQKPAGYGNNSGYGNDFQEDIPFDN